ncbi:hypothetical protein IFM89_037563 [Coptis chinensis]|uniref:Uncharacterized protein n=1 Tax=Coptis chinensis TaxID=261450 RepID=A0A835HWV4_9MAGN|nr:hypothetical protein IFM89_037563 [Coptis chinensis]
MRDFPTCFGENAVQIADSSSSSNKAAQNLVTCVYQTKLRGNSCLVNVTWNKSMMGQGLSVGIDNSANQCLCKVDIKPWLFSKRKGSKSLEVDAIFDKEIGLLLGDLTKEAYKKSNVAPIPSDANYIAKREHIFGKRFYCTKAQFSENGKFHDIAIECDTGGLVDPCLMIRIDTKMMMQVKRLKWKFRGNQSIVIDGNSVEVFWDVHSWLFGTSLGNAVFMFHTCFTPEKLWSSNMSSDSAILSLSKSLTFRDSQLQGLGFSLILYAWKNE